MPFSSNINTGLPETPRGVRDSQEYEQLLLIYNAIRALQAALDSFVAGGGIQGPQGPAGAGSSLFELTPYYIPSGETFTVPVNKQALFSETIINDGTLVVDGLLLEVD